jgi:hypothetical protein
MEGKFRVTFKDGTTEEVSAPGRTEAKDKARALRLNALDPGGKLDANERFKHPQVKIVDIKEIVPDGLIAVLVAIGLAVLYALDRLTAAHFGHVTAADALWLQGFSGTAIGATLAALTAVSGDSLQIPMFPEGKRAMLIQAWTDVQVAGTARIKSPLWHDNTNGIRKDTIISELNPFMPFGFGQPIYRGDVLTVELAGSAVGGDIEYVCLLMWFEQLTTGAGNFIAPDLVRQKVINYSYVENTIATGATAAWAGAEAINAETDQFHAHRKYALVGYCCDTEVPAIAWKGIDTANVRVGGPGLDQDQLITNNWFERLSLAYGKALIPLIEADNKSSTMIDSLQDENGADTTVISIYAELPA